MSIDSAILSRMSDAFTSLNRFVALCLAQTTKVECLHLLAGHALLCQRPQTAVEPHVYLLLHKALRNGETGTSPPAHRPACPWLRLRRSASCRWSRSLAQRVGKGIPGFVIPKLLRELVILFWIHLALDRVHRDVVVDRQTGKANIAEVAGIADFHGRTPHPSTGRAVRR